MDDEKYLIEERARIERLLKEEVLEMRALMLDETTKLIIGDGSETIRQLRAESDVKIWFSKQVYGNEHRILFVKGLAENVAQTFGSIARILAMATSPNAVDINAVHVEIKFLFPNPVVGRIIGKGGLNVKEITKASAAIVKKSYHFLEGSTDRLVSIYGVPNSIHIATYYMAEAYFKTVAYGIDLSREIPYQPREGPVKEVSEIIIDRSDTKSPTLYAVPQPSIKKRRRSDFSDHEDDVRPGHLMRIPNLEIQSIEPSKSGNLLSNITKVVTYPDKYSSKVIGREGTYINMLRESTSCSIRLKSPDDKEDLAIISIRGPPLCVDAALLLIAHRIELSKRLLDE
ncbi:hypothetical protein NCAS_0H01320 [Naumovozyma castellii]|uniref:K Homology domain-containing protein n=1 Tax=Naumovozyma castellii TaxID=27288 RepID=G0VIW5_NAUCA|nr:hypothetical protein NCAS_0H01320 [Naumovozyma castellii CBS 4309]CCC71442.1 hypothetical protein NCAS_0H01320 [Naumovozyma castellii CBS 4309]